MPYQIKWVFEKKPLEILEGCKSAILSMAKNPCPWNLVSCDEKTFKLIATRTTRTGYIDDITIKVLPVSLDSSPQCVLDFYSNNREGLYDWGQNRRNSLEFYKALPWVPKPYDKQKKLPVPPEFREILKCMLRREDGVPVKDRTYHFKTYKDCFVGSEFVDWLVNHHKSSKPEFSRTDALKLGQQMIEKGIFAHVVSDHNLKDEFLFYRFQVDMDELMGAEENGTEAPKKNLEELVEDMKKNGILKDKLSGSDLYNWIITRLSTDKEEAISIIEQLVDCKLLVAESEKFSDKQMYSFAQ